MNCKANKYYKLTYLNIICVSGFELFVNKQPEWQLS